MSSASLKPSCARAVHQEALDSLLRLKRSTVDPETGAFWIEVLRC
jgi:hypothetical protein